jgi:hypothetical protein
MMESSVRIAPAKSCITILAFSRPRAQTMIGTVEAQRSLSPALRPVVPA